MLSSNSTINDSPSRHNLILNGVPLVVKRNYGNSVNFGNITKNGVFVLSKMTINFDEIKQTLGVKSVSAIAKRAGIPVSTLVDVANGRSKTLSAENAQKLAACVGVTVDELYGKKKSPDTEVPEADVDFQKLWAMYQSLSDEGKENADKYLDFLLNTQDND